MKLGCSCSTDSCSEETPGGEVEVAWPWAFGVFAGYAERAALARSEASRLFKARIGKSQASA